MFYLSLLLFVFRCGPMKNCHRIQGVAAEIVFEKNKQKNRIITKGL